MRGLVPALLVVGIWVPVVGADAPADRTHFGTAEEALQALKQAAAARDRDTLKKIFGPQLQRIDSGDPVQDSADFDSFAQRLEKRANLVSQGADQMILHVGAEGYPFPVPIVKDGSAWFFDTEEGIEEILDRRVGENELNAIRVCRGYVAAQYEYFGLDRDEDGVLEYAQQLASTSAKRDGLYWDTEPSEQPSPLGPLVAQARAEGYAGRKTGSASEAQAYHGYRYKLLTRQGGKAPGGAFDYVINGNMVAGFALAAYPAEWGSSGVMTLVVNSNGMVYEKDLGEKTAELATKISAYDPDDSWKPAEE